MYESKHVVHMLERCEVPSCTGSRAKSEMGVLKEGVEEFDCVLVL